MNGLEKQIQAGMAVYDRQGGYLGMVTRVYPVPARFLPPGGVPFGCFKVRRGPFPFFGPPPLLVPFDAVRAVVAAEAAVRLGVAREEAAEWAGGRQG